MSVSELISTYPQIVECLKKEDITRFRKFQELAIEAGLLKGKNLLIAAPTGSGKTLIGELAILKHLLKQENKKALFLVPLKAVANEKYDEFLRKYGDLFTVKISTGDYETIPEELTEAGLIIATYERFDSLLRTQPDWLFDIAVVIIDEVHMIGQKERGPRLESVIIRLKEYLPYTQLICLSATVKNWEELSDWLETYPIISDERPVPLLVKILVTQEKLSLIKNLIEKTISINGQVLVFVMTRREAEYLAGRIGDSIDNSLLRSKGAKIDVSSVSDLSVKLREILPKGVGYHHAGLISSDRKIVETYFRQSLIKVIFSTTTLSAGINVPARLVILKDTRIGKAEKPLRTLTSNEIFQILGRAGRPGLDAEGIGIVLTEDEAEKKQLEAYMYIQTSDGKKLEEEYEPILSQFDDVSTLREQVLVKIYEKRRRGLAEDELISFFKRTFWAYLERKAGRDPLPKYSGRSIGEILSDIEPTELLDRAKLLLSDIELLDASKNRLLGRVGNYVVSFDEKKGHYCNCSVRDSTICFHRIAFALFCESHKELEAYKKTIVRNALEKDIFTYLNQADLIKIRDDKYFVTDFGRAAVLHYIRPETSQIIRNVLLTTSAYTTENILLLGMKILTEEFSTKYTATELFDCLDQWINESELTDVLKTIEPGDFESIRSSINWILNAILGIGRSMGSDIEEALEQIVKPLIERIRVGVKEELTKISPFFEYTDRKKLRRLYELGIKTVADLINKKEVI